MFRQRGSAYSRQARRRRAWLTWLVALAGCAVVVLAVHFATAPSTVQAVSSADIGKAGHFRAYDGQADYRGYGRGGYPMMPHTTQEAAATTMNWAGYAETEAAGTFTSVSSSWTQPAVTCDAADTFSGFWVGLDGAGTPTVEQTGTEADCANGTAEATPSALNGQGGFSVTWNSSGAAVTTGTGSPGTTGTGRHHHQHRNGGQG